MNLTEVLNEEIAFKVLFEIPLPFGYKLPITDTIVVMWIIMAVMIVGALILNRKMKLVPEGKQNITELMVEFINNLAKDAIGHHWKPFAPYLGTIFYFLIFANIISIFNIIPSSEDLFKITHIEFFEHLPHFALKPPTKDINVPASMAIMTALLTIIASVRFKKLSGWLKSFIEPSPIMLPFKALELATKPLSLCLRLFGNILAAFMIMELVYIAIKSFLPAAFAPGLLSIYFDLFDGILQAYVFVFLTSLYIGEAVEEEHH